MSKEIILVGAAAGIGGLILGKWGGPIEVKLTSMSIPPQIVHFSLVAASAMGVYYLGRRVL